jgi:hypothetical protein
MDSRRPRIRRGRVEIKGPAKCAPSWPCVVRLFMQITRLITKTTVCCSPTGAHDQANRYIGAANRVYADMLFPHVSSTHSATSRTRLTSLTWEPARSSSTGIKSSSSLSWASENQLLMGTACCGWKMYEVGELSMMMVSLRSRPICDKSYGGQFMLGKYVGSYGVP